MTRNYAQICQVYDKDDKRDWGITSSRVSGIYWDLYSDYPLAIEFKNGDVYGYAVQMVRDVRGVPLGMECWHVLVQLLNVRNKYGEISIGMGINKILNDCPYMKLGGELF